MDVKILSQIFGEIAESSNVIYGMISEELRKNRYGYVYMSMEAFQLLGKEKGVEWINEYMTHETLQRIFIATLTGYLRQHKWIEGICQGIKLNNYLLFASSARGFLEAASDYYDALEVIPLVLAEQYKLFVKALNGKVNDMIIGFNDIENRLLHFQEANKRDGKNNSNLIPKTAKEYMESKNLKEMDLYSCYGELCEVTHPAKQSLEYFLEENDNFVYTIKLEKDKYKINAFLIKYASKYSELLMRTENLCIIIFKIINLFNIKELYLIAADKIDTRTIKLWEKIESYIYDK